MVTTRDFRTDHTTQTDANSFAWIDTAVGGMKNRNRLQQVGDFHPPDGAVDAFATYLQYDDGLVKHVRTHHNDKGNPTVAGYRGPCITHVVPFDLDCAGDLARALTETRRLVTHLQGKGIPRDAVSVCFSGSKGFSVEVPMCLFGGCEPNSEVPARLGALVSVLTSDLDGIAGVIDWNVYQHLRLWRLPNTINAKSGLHKIPLTFNELFTLDIEEITALAAGTRDVSRVPADEWPARAGLVDLWRGAAGATGTTSAGQASYRKDPVNLGRVLSGLPHGQRNTELFRAASYLRRMKVAQAYAEWLVCTAAANCYDPVTGQPDPFREEDAREIVGRVYSRYAEGGPPLTDLGNAERFAALHGGDLRYCEKLGGWFTWDGRRWVLDETGGVMRRAGETARSMYTEAAEEEDRGRRGEIGKWAYKSEAEPRLQAMVSLARWQPGVAVVPGAFDADPWLLTCQNGTVDLRTALLQPHRRGDMITKLAPVVYDPGATCPRFERFLAEIMAGREEMVSFLRRWFGYSLTGDTREHKLAIFYGSGRNGKGTLVEVVRDVMGDYAKATPADTLMTRRSEGPRNDVARLPGARLVTATETTEGRKLDEALIKTLTGGDTVSARFLHREFFEFRPAAKLVLSTNYRPEIKGTDTGIWSRVQLVPFSVVFKENEQDTELPGKLREELPGILAWMVRGCLEWQRSGLAVPDDVRNATAAYQADMDVAGQFLNACCDTEDGAHVQGGELYACFRRWCERSGAEVLSDRAFAQRLRGRGFVDRHTRVGTVWAGLRLKPGVRWEED